MNKAFYFLLVLILILSGCAPTFVEKQLYDYSKMDKMTRHAYMQVDKFLQTCINKKYPVEIVEHTRIDTILIDQQKQHLNIYLNNWFKTIPFRQENTALINNVMRNNLAKRFKNYSFNIYADKQHIEQLIPNYFRKNISEYDKTRMPKEEKRSVPLIRNISKPWQPDNGLYNRNIALWHSHGWYYERKLNRWEWQRARVFQTVEDLLPMAFTVPYLVPMLENAGAQVFLPRERDIQKNEVVIDNDTPDNAKFYFEYTHSSNNTWHSAGKTGFAVGNPPYSSGFNPFRSGTYKFIESDTVTSAGIRWIPDTPESGKYGVYISFASSDSNVTDAHYTVYHAGGKTEFLVNQQIGGGTWNYLGRFKFNKGYNPSNGRVVLTNKSRESGKYITADAVRFGGGMGNIARNGMVSGRPRFTEAARYYLQYAGMPDTLVYNFFADTVDYNDDYLCRGEWVNYLKGAPFGPNKDRSVKGLGIPIDLSFGFHTDAGFARSDTVIGTLMIYSTKGANSPTMFPDSMSRLANRDFADILQTQIVEDIRAKYDPVWNRRWLWDRPYSEAYTPNVPAVLLELLSHHNFLDMKFALDPRFRFDTSRSIYKAMLRFIATQYKFKYIIQPLPVSHFQVTFFEKRAVVLKWKATVDPLEETAVAEKYIVYTRIGDNDFNNGVIVDKPQITIKKLEPGTIYSFKVTAVNTGGESFPSEILTACYMSNENKPLLIINGFDRISAPATIETGEYLGFANFWDQGVPDKYDLNYVGAQYDFLASSPWLDDDAPGRGASYGNNETKIIAGNTFDYPYLYGKSIQAAGYSFVSVSDEVVEDGLIDIRDYQTVVLILGEEKETAWPKNNHPKEFKAFPKNLQNQIKSFCNSGNNIFISGAYVGTDLWHSIDSTDIRFATDILKFRFLTNYATKQGEIYSVDPSFYAENKALKFNTDFCSDIYAAEAPDAIEPADSTAFSIFRYSENNTGAAIAYDDLYKIVVFGFPFETIINQNNRDSIMKAILNFFEN